MSQASTSTRGVTAHAINVVFPVVAINSEAGQLGFAEDKEYNEQAYAIRLYVNEINASGGIHGRKINPIIASFNPSNETEMRSLCKQWTQGTPAAFAVVDGIGTWTGDNELCVTQEGQTPMIGGVDDGHQLDQMGSPYLWWTGADQVPVLAATVQWGVSSGRLGQGKKVGVVVSDQAADQLAPALVPVARPQEGGHHPAGVHDLGRPQRDGQHGLRRPAGGGAPQGGRGPIGDPPSPRERLLPLRGGRERSRSTSPSCS